MVPLSHSAAVSLPRKTATLGNCSVKARRRRVELLGADLGGEPADGFGEDGGVDFLAVAGDEGVVELVDEAHGEEGAGVDGRWRGRRRGRAASIERCGELAAGRDVGEDDVAGVAEEQFVEL